MVPFGVAAVKWEHPVQRPHLEKLLWCLSRGACRGWDDESKPEGSRLGWQPGVGSGRAQRSAVGRRAMLLRGRRSPLQSAVAQTLATLTGLLIIWALFSQAVLYVTSILNEPVCIIQGTIPKAGMGSMWEPTPSE